MTTTAVISDCGALMELAARPPRTMINRPRRKIGYRARFGIRRLLPIVFRTSTK